MIEYEELKVKYAAVKEQESALGQQSSCKKDKKELLLSMKENNTITKEGNSELEYMEREDAIESTYRNNIATIMKAKERAIREAEEKYDTAMSYYTREREQSMTKAKRIYDTKKRTLELQKNRIEGERSISSKTAAELSIEKQKRAILKEMKEFIDGIDIARSQIPEKERDFLFDIPELPEPIVDAHIPTAPVTPARKPKRVISEDQWMSYGEDASLAQMREQARMEKSVRPEYDIRPNPTPYGLIGTAKDVDKLYTKPADLPDEEEKEKAQVDDDEYDEEYIAERKAEFRELWSVPV
jgi:hypothetical protein